MLLHLLSVMLSSGRRLHHIWERSFGPELTEGKIEHPCASCRPARSPDGVMRRDSGTSCSGRSMFCLIRGAICCTSNARARGQEQSKRGNSELHCTTIPSTHPRRHAGVESAQLFCILLVLACATQGFRVSTSGHFWCLRAPTSRRSALGIPAHSLIRQGSWPTQQTLRRRNTRARWQQTKKLAPVIALQQVVPTRPRDRC